MAWCKGALGAMAHPSLWCTAKYNGFKTEVCKPLGRGPWQASSRKKVGLENGFNHHCKPQHPVGVTCCSHFGSTRTSWAVVLLLGLPVISSCNPTPCHALLLSQVDGWSPLVAVPGSIAHICFQVLWHALVASVMSALLTAQQACRTAPTSPASALEGTASSKPYCNLQQVAAHI